MANKETDNKNHLVVVNFKLLTDTKGAVRYEEVDDNGKPRKGDGDGAIIGTAYLRKLALNKLGKGTPKELRFHIDIRPET